MVNSNLLTPTHKLAFKSRVKYVPIPKIEISTYVLGNNICKIINKLWKACTAICEFQQTTNMCMTT